MSIERNEFIQTLASRPVPSRQWLPAKRLMVWYSMALVANIIVMAWVQPFRPNFVEHLSSYYRFSLEIFSGLALTGFFIYWLFNSLIPGHRGTRSFLILGSVLTITFVLTLALSFFSASPPASTLGARPYCVEEVFVYGLFGVLSFLLLMRNSEYTPTKPKILLFGLSAGFIPALLMQMSCLYDPVHGLLFHYGPLILLSLIGLSLPKLKGLLHFQRD